MLQQPSDFPPLDEPEAAAGPARRRGATVKTRKSWPYMSFAFRTFRNLFLTFFFNWFMIITQPVNAMFLLTVFPTIVVVLLVIELVLKVFMDYLGGSAIVSEWSTKYGGGLSMVNWGQPDIFTSHSTEAIVRRGIVQLSIPAQIVTSTNPNVRRKFNLSIAQTLLVLSALIYERKDADVKKAFKIATNSRNGKIYDPKIRRLIEVSETVIKERSRAWGLEFESLSELKSNEGGPFVGLFTKESTNALILVFKGTTPTDYSEFLIDATIQRADARPFVFGEVHEGFYNSLFPATGDDSGRDRRNPYGDIVTGIRNAAARLKRKNGKPVQLWITGHSLGAALASVLFARLLKCPVDLGDDIVLRDIYCFGTPAIGSNDFAAIFASHTNNGNSTTNAHSTLWRVINGSDIVSRLPVANDDPTVARFLTRESFFNYAHVGIGVQLRGSTRVPYINASVYQTSVDVDVVLREDLPENLIDPGLGKETETTLINEADRAGDSKGWNPITVLESMYPFFFHAHFPVRYLRSLNGAMEILEKKEAKA